jgi:hypothetical protein
MLSHLEAPEFEFKKFGKILKLVHYFCLSTITSLDLYQAKNVTWPFWRYMEMKRYIYAPAALPPRKKWVVTFA